MKIILHAGMPKAGSTALQTTLRRAHASLLRKGVLYPITPEGHQNFAIAGVVPFSRLPRGYRQAYATRESAVEIDFKKYWRKIVSQIDRYRPHTLLLSGEAFYRRFSPEEAGKLTQLIRPLSDSVEVVIYARRPSEYYLSNVQQALRASHKIKPIGPIEYRLTIEPYLNYIADSLRVIPYVRNELYERDIAQDFALRFIPDCIKDVSTSAAGPVNETISAEAMSILQSYRSQNHFDRADIHTIDSSILINIIRDIERDTGLFSKPKLKPEIVTMVDRLSKDVLWLKEAFGISYEGLDEASMTVGGGTISQPSTVADICEVDFDKRDHLLMLVLQQVLVRDLRYSRIGRIYNSKIGRFIRSIYKSLLGERRNKEVI